MSARYEAMLAELKARADFAQDNLVRAIGQIAELQAALLAAQARIKELESQSAVIKEDPAHKPEAPMGPSLQ